MKTYRLIYGDTYTEFKAVSFADAALMADALSRVKCWINPVLYLRTADYREFPALKNGEQEYARKLLGGREE